MSKGLDAATTSGAAASVGASAAADRHQLLEACLPPSAADMLDMIRAHARAGAHHRFAATQLLRLAATCMVSVPSSTANVHSSNRAKPALLPACKL
jgi:hypothetical protein